MTHSAWTALYCLRALPLSSGEAQSLSSGEPAITPWSTSPARTWLFSGTARQQFTSEQDLSGRSRPGHRFHQSKSLHIKYELVCRLFLHQGLLSGLCGNFDSVTVNDMTTSSHIEVNNAQTFGDSWALGQVFVNSSLFLDLLPLLFLKNKITFSPFESKIRISLLISMGKCFYVAQWLQFKLSKLKQK